MIAGRALEHVNEYDILFHKLLKFSTNVVAVFMFYIQIIS